MLSIVAVLTLMVGLLPVLYWAWLQYNSHQLWQIVSQRCVPEQQRHHSPSPCLLVDLAQRYAVFNDRNGPLHTLLIPTDKIAGIESAELLNRGTENYFQHGWDQRHLLQQQATFPLPDRYLAQAINSRYGRTQNQLHIHLACLKPDVYQAVQQQKNAISHQWQALETRLSGRRYIAIKVAATTNPFLALAAYLQAQGDSMENYGLIRLVTDANETILLATRVQLTAFSLGTAEELLDVNCHLAQAKGTSSAE